MRQVREVLRLKFVGGLSNHEIARRLGVAPSTQEELTFADLVASGLLAAVDRFAGCLIDKLGSCG